MKVNAPQGAKIFLEHEEVNSESSVFRTTKLSHGQSWDNYRVRVTIHRNGRTIDQEQSVTLRGGKSHELTFRFDEIEEVAALR